MTNQTHNHSSTINYLLVDDDEVFCKTLSKSLLHRGINSIVAHNNSSALEQLKEHSHTVSHAVVDLNIGNDSGLNLIPQLLSIKPKLTIVVLTGYSSIATTVEAIKRGAFNYLCKPASADAIINAFNNSEHHENVSPSVHQQQPSVERVEWEYIQKTLAENNGNVSATARALGMHRRTLQRKLQKKPVAQ